MALNTNSNVYTVVYATVLTVIVAIGLTAAAVGLKPQQEANAANEKKQQILSAVLGQEVTFDNAAEKWAELDMDNNMFVVSLNGEKVELDEKADKAKNALGIVAKKQFKAGIVKEDAKLPVFVANIDGKTYYIMCMYGGGLWDAIWGYIAVEADGSTVAGATFDHAGETAGLGAKIKDDPAFAEKFIGKKVFVNGEFAPVTVSKNKGDNNVDVITGATKTSECVSVMVAESLKGYKAFLEGIVKGAPAQPCCAEQAPACCGHCPEGEGCCKAEADSCCAEQAPTCGECTKEVCDHCNVKSENVAE